MKIQPVEFIIANNLPYLEGSILKYICRHRAKNGKQDLKKAAHYLQMLIEAEYAEDIPVSALNAGIVCSNERRLQEAR